MVQIEHNQNDILVPLFSYAYKVRKSEKIRNRYNQAPHLTQVTIIAQQTSSFSAKIYVVCTQKNRLNETILLSTHKQC